MLSVLDKTRVKRLLCLGAHCDDIEIGAGGTIMRLAKAQPQIEVRWVIFAGEDPIGSRRRAARRGFLGRHRASEISIYGFRDGFLPFQGELIKEADICRDKIAGLFEAFPSQAKRQWFDDQTFWSLLRLRGVECNAPSRLAEAFLSERSLPDAIPTRSGAPPSRSLQSAARLSEPRLAQWAGSDIGTIENGA